MTIILQGESNVTHYDPRYFGRLREPVIVLRKVDIAKLSKRETPTADTAWELIAKGQAQLHIREDRLPWYEQGLIINDNPRDEKVARAIQKATLGYALARTDTGEVLKKYGPDAFSEAVADAASVRLTVRADILPVIKEEDNEDQLIAEFLSDNEESEDQNPAAQEA